jgi:hypothetical protein
MGETSKKLIFYYYYYLKIFKNGNSSGLIGTCFSRGRLLQVFTGYTYNNTNIYTKTEKT